MNEPDTYERDQLLIEDRWNRRYHNRYLSGRMTRWILDALLILVSGITITGQKIRRD